MRRLPADRRAALRLRYLGECRRLPTVIALAEAAFIACAMGRFGMSVAGAVHIGGALVASACVCAVGEAESTRAGRFSRRRYGVADPELVRAGAPMILIPVSAALALTGILATVNGGAADAPSIAAGAGYQLIAAPLLLAAMVRFSATRTVSPLAELIFLLIMLTPGLAVLAGAATLIHRRGRRHA
jgi:membrane protein